MYLPIFDGKYELIEKLTSDETSSTWLVKASGSSVEFVMLTIKDPEVSAAVLNVLKAKTSPVPSNIVDWQIQDFTLDLICEKPEIAEKSNLVKKTSSYLEKAERSRILFKDFIPYEKENCTYQTLLTSEDAVQWNGKDEFSYYFPLRLPSSAGCSGRENLCENFNLHLNKIFSPGIDAESHLYYNAAPPELAGLLARYRKSEIKTISDLYYAYTHSGFYKMFGNQDYVEDGIGIPVNYRSNRESMSPKKVRAVNDTKKARKLKKGKSSISMTNSEAEKSVHNIGEMNFNSALVKPSTNSRGMRHIKAMRRLKIAIFLVLFLIATPLIAQATGFDDWFTLNLKKTGLGGAILNSEPIAGFAPDTGKIIENVPITFINQSVDRDPNDSIVSSHWTVVYNNATLYDSQEMHMLYSFPAVGKYKVSLIVEDSRGKSSEVKTIEYKISKALNGTENPGDAIK